MCLKEYYYSIYMNKKYYSRHIVLTNKINQIYIKELTLIVPKCFFWSPNSEPSCEIPSRLSSSSIVLDTTLEEGSRLFNRFEELVEELDGRSVEELLICVMEDEIPVDFPSLLEWLDSDTFVPKSKFPLVIGRAVVVVASEDVDRLGK